MAPPNGSTPQCNMALITVHPRWSYLANSIPGRGDKSAGELYEEAMQTAPGIVIGGR